MYKRVAMAGAAALVLVCAPSAFAQVQVLDVTHGIEATGHAQGVQSGDHLLVEYACRVTASPTAVSVTISRCGIDRNNVQSFSGPNGAIKSQEDIYYFPYQLCWTATALFPDTTEKTTSGCTDKAILDIGFGESHEF